MIDASTVTQKAEHLVDAAFADEMAEHIAEANKKLRKLQRVMEQGGEKDVLDAQRTFLRSFSARVCCLVLSLKRTDDQPLTSLSVREMAERLNAYADPGEEVRAYARIKSTRGDWRPICVFGPKRKALQTLAGFVLMAKFGSHPLDYGARGRGTEVAADRIKDLIDDGVRHFVVADIEACFRSVKQKQLGQRLGLPPAVVQHCLLIGENTTLRFPPDLPYDTCPQAFSETVRQGIPQGARSSSRVASLLLGPELRSCTSDDRSILYGDDFAIPTATRTEAETIAKTLPGIFESHSAGPFRLKRCEVCNTNEGFNFLKYRFRRDRFEGIGKLRPSKLSYDRFQQRVREIISSTELSTIYKAVILYRTRWLESFRRYHANDEAIEFLWLTTISTLPPTLMIRWNEGCRRYKEANIFPPCYPITWIR